VIRRAMRTAMRAYDPAGGRGPAGPDGGLSVQKSHRERMRGGAEIQHLRPYARRWPRDFFAWNGRFKEPTSLSRGPESRASLTEHFLHWKGAALALDKYILSRFSCPGFPVFVVPVFGGFRSRFSSGKFRGCCTCHRNPVTVI
jgi:hypothetical protein